MFRSIVEAVFYYAETQPEKLCLADDENQVTYREYREKIEKYVSCFALAELKKGDRVVAEACQTIEYLAVELALQLMGAVFVPVEHNCAMEKIQSFVERSEAKAVITCKEGKFSAPYTRTYTQLEEELKTAECCAPTAFPEAEEISEILFSTGTTGKEKGIVLIHQNDITLAQNVINGVKMEKDNVELIPSPMNHSHGLRRYYANMYNGSTAVLLGSIMNVKKVFYDLDTFQVNSIAIVPAALSVLLKLSKGKLAEYRDQLRYVQFGAAPMLEADQQQICELLPNTHLYNFYGSTESGCICIYDFNRKDRKKRCIGKPVCNAKLVMVDDDQQPIQSSKDHTGLLSSEGRMNMLGYWKDPEETEKVLRNGIVYTNDVAYYDEDGDIILMGRKGDVINVAGNKVAPEEVENAAKKMSGVADCGVIAVEDPMKGHVPKLFVQLDPGCVFDPVKIRTYLAENLEPYKVPVYIEQIAKIPRSYNGKLLRRELAAL